MRSTVVTLAAVAALTTIGCTAREAPSKADTTTPATATTASTNDAAAVRQAIDAGNARFATGMNTGDTAAMLGVYADSAIVMPPNGKAAHGHDEIAKGFAGMTAAMKVSNAKLTTTDLIVSGDYAMETGTYAMTATPKGGKAMNDTGKYETVWKKQADGSWKLIRDIWNSDAAMK